jgi:hypothetical protein
MAEKPKRTAPEAWVEAGKPHRWKKGESGNQYKVPRQLEPFLWEKGQCPNPGGRPKSKALSQALRKRLEDPVPNDQLGRTFAEVIADSWVYRAMKGDTRAAETLASRAEGQPLSSLTIAATLEIATEERIARVKQMIDELKAVEL